MTGAGEWCYVDMRALEAPEYSFVRLIGKKILGEI
jgi:hypothetical protein